MTNAERTRLSKTVAEVAAELQKLIVDGWEYPDAHSLLCEVYKIPSQVLQDACQQPRPEGRGLG